MKKLFLKNWMLTILLLSTIWHMGMGQNGENRPLNIIIFGAHPDDAEKSGGTAYKWIQSGAHVMMVSLTNGDAGHQSIPAKELAAIRARESRDAGNVIGAKYINLDNHDGMLEVTLENRFKVIKLIRQWNADIVITHRPYDYHPDHRNTGRLVMDAAFMVTVPKIVPETPHLEKNPLFLWVNDNFIHPEPFVADVAIDIDDAIDKKIAMYDKHASQVYSWLPYNRGILDEVPESPEARREWLAQSWLLDRSRNNADKYRDRLIEIYGEEKGSKVENCEAFQDSGYGVQLTEDNLYYYFPFLKK